MPGRAVTSAMLRAIDALVLGVVTALYAVIIAAMFAQVLFRYVLGSPLSWSEEISRYMFIWLCYLGAYVAVIRNAHVGVDYLTRHFPPPVMRALHAVFGVIILGMLGFVVYWGAFLTRDNVAAGWWTVPFLSMGLAYAAVPVGGALMMLGVIRALLQLVAGPTPAPERADAGEPRAL